MTRSAVVILNRRDTPNKRCGKPAAGCDLFPHVMLTEELHGFIAVNPQDFRIDFRTKPWLRLLHFATPTGAAQTVTISNLSDERKMDGLPFKRIELDLPLYSQLSLFLATIYWRGMRFQQRHQTIDRPG